MVTALEDLRIKRVLRRDAGRTTQQVKSILAQQWTEEEKGKLANGVIRNDESELVTIQVLHFHEILKTGKLPSAST